MPGLKPGQRHSGQFRKGHDPRRGRATGEQIAQGKTLAQLARDHTQEALGILVEVINDDNREDAVRIKAAQYVLDRGWGRAPSHQLIEHLHGTDPKQMTTEQLEEHLRGMVIEGQFTEVTQQPWLSREVSSNG